MMKKFVLDKANEFAKIIYDHPGKFTSIADAKQRLFAATEIFDDSNKVYYLMCKLK